MINLIGSPEDLLKKGVYKILNKLTGKYYIGSTIMRSIKRNTSYKGLIFSDKPLHQEIDVEKQGELLENPLIKDNQQPSLSSNTLEGSTTNSQILNKDSNRDTSPLQPLVIERDKDGNPLVSLSWTILDFSKKVDDIV